MKSVDVVPIRNTKKEIRKFVQYSWKIYKDNPYWVPPLISQQVNFIHDGIYHESGIIQPFMAYRNGEPVGRIVAHYDRRYNEIFQKKRGCIGFFECTNDKNVSRMLFDASRDWLTAQGMHEMYGPLNFTMYDAAGLLMDDYQNEPVLELVYNPPYYTTLFEDYGFEKAVDWYAYRFTRDQNIPGILYRARDRVLNNPSGIQFRNMDLKEDYWESAQKMREVFNRAWDKNWGHLPLTERQWNYFAGEVKSALKPELVLFAEKDSQLIGYMLSVPDVNQAIKHANGRLFPLGLLKMLWAFRKINRIKIFMLGVLPEYRNQGIESFFLLETYERGKKMGYLEADMSVIVEINTNVLRMLDRAGAQRYKTFRHFTKTLHG